MSLINSELTVAAQKSLDGKMYKVVSNKSVPYDSIADVLATITSTRRHIGQKFRYIDGSGISDCHFVGDITDGSLVKIDYGTGGPYADSITASANTSYSIATGVAVTGILIDSATGLTLNIGSSIGASDIAAGVAVTGGTIQTIVLLIPAKIIYFSGISAAIKITLFKNYIP